MSTTSTKKLQARGIVEQCTLAMAVQWNTTKAIGVINCHKPEVEMVESKNKNGFESNIVYSESVLLYRHMGGIDLANQPLKKCLISFYLHQLLTHGYYTKKFRVGQIYETD